MSDNTLYYGDNLDVLRRRIYKESVDLVYLDLPFNSNANYNMLFAEHDGAKAGSQIQAFTDTWQRTTQQLLHSWATSTCWHRLKAGWVVPFSLQPEQLQELSFRLARNPEKVSVPPW